MIDKTQIEKFDFIIIGLGLSGITLLLELLKRTKKKILIIEKKKKLNRDKNWCFWSYPKNFLTNKYRNSWKEVIIKYKTKEISKREQNYSYLQVYSDDLYKIAIDKLNKSNNCKLLLNQEINYFKETSDGVYLDINEKSYFSEIVFDSRPSQVESGKLLQHFYGIEVESNKKAFNTNEVTLMHFQDNDKEIHFFYILPYSEKKALIETTYFSKKIYQEQKYLKDIESYINKEYPKINFKYGFKEKGVIPMYEIKNNVSSKIIKIGTAGNWTRISTGYTLQNSFKKSREIVDCIINKKKIKLKKDMISNFLDKVFCKYLEIYPEKSNILFIRFFEKLKLSIIIKFLTNKYHFFDLIKVIFSLPKLQLLKCLVLVLKND